MSKKKDLIQQLRGAREDIKLPGTNKEGKVSKLGLAKSCFLGLKKPTKIGVPQVFMVAGGVLALTLLAKPSKKKSQKSKACDCVCDKKPKKGKLSQIIAVGKFLAPVVTTVFGYFRPQIEKALADFLAKQASKNQSSEASE